MLSSPADGWAGTATQMKRGAEAGDDSPGAIHLSASCWKHDFSVRYWDLLASLILPDTPLIR